MTFCQSTMFALPNDTSYNNFHRKLFAMWSLVGRALIRVTRHMVTPGEWNWNNGISGCHMLFGTIRCRVANYLARTALWAVLWQSELCRHTI